VAINLGFGWGRIRQKHAGELLAGGVRLSLRLDIPGRERQRSACVRELPYIRHPDAFPTVGQKTQAFLGSRVLPPPLVLARTLVNDLDTIDQDFILVLDDYHYIRETAIHYLMAELLRHPPRAMHLALLTRRDPPLPLITLRARGQVNEITMEQLRFTPEETAAFLQKVLEVSIDDTTAAILEEKIEGWVPGLRLAALSLRGQKDLDRFVSGLREGFKYITDYLISEIVSRQPPAMARYLMETAILDRFCPALCEAIHLSKGEPGEMKSVGRSLSNGWRRPTFS
jgi:LuxR family maltose regulon positive regulatory protein